MGIVEEMKIFGFDVPSSPPKVYCRAYEDNTGALELVRVPKMRPRTKHINVVYHHFREYVRRGVISVVGIDTTNQLADLLTKPLEKEKFLALRKSAFNF